MHCSGRPTRYAACPPLNSRTVQIWRETRIVAPNTVTLAGWDYKNLIATGLISGSRSQQSETFCRLQKNAYAKWHIEKQVKGPRYYDYDVVYFECIYNKKQEENRFLTQLLEYLDQ